MHLRAADLAETSFAISPLQETVFSLWVWRRPERQAIHLPWRTAQLSAWRTLDTEVLGALVAPRGWLPDFLTPRPASPLTEFEAELDRVRATPPRLVRRDVLAAYQDQPVPGVLRQRPSVVQRRIAAALAEYWQACVLPSWARMRPVLEADIVYRSRQLAVGGARALFEDLDARVRWDDGLLSVDRFPGENRRIEVGGRGLRLVPSLFCRGAATYLDGDGPPSLSYPARGRGAVWEAQRPVAADAALVDLLGAPRARLLLLLGQPAATVELARRTGVSPSAVSQHLRVLHAAGLVNRSRSGRSVLYLRSTVADGLVGMSAATE